MSLRPSKAFAFTLLVAGLLPAIRLFAQDEVRPEPQPQDRLTVRARGRVVVPADEIELELVVVGSAEEAREAEKKHRDKLRRVVAALTGHEAAREAKDDEGADDDKPRKRKVRKGDDDALPEPGKPDENGLLYEVREGRYSFGIKGAGQNGVEEEEDPTGQGRKAEPELRVGSAVHVYLRNVAKVPVKKVRALLARVLDRAGEAGAEMGSSPRVRLQPTVRFRAKDPEELKRRAYGEALRKGRARAEDLAKLIRRDLGKLSVCTDLEPAQVNAGNPEAAMGYDAFLVQVQSTDGASDDTFSASSEVAVEVFVQLDFELK